MALAAICSSLRVTFTPTLMLGAMTMAVRWAKTAISAFCASVKPVVPTTAFTPSSQHTARWARVPSGRVKSIRTSAFFRPAAMSAVMATPLAWPRNAVASEPMPGLDGTSSAPASTQSSLARRASISMRPMRPDAPATATRRGRDGVDAGAGEGVPVMSVLYVVVGFEVRRASIYPLPHRPDRENQRAGASSGGGLAEACSSGGAVGVARLEEETAELLSHFQL